MKNIIFERLKGFKGLTTQNISMIIENCSLIEINLKNELIKLFFILIIKILKITNWKIYLI